MKTYSLYLSTLAGSTIGAIFTATITDNGTTLTSTSGTGVVAVNQYLVILGQELQITAVNATVFTLSKTVNGGANSAISNSYISYTINANSGKYAPINKYNLSQLKWNINWREIFGNDVGECRVRAKLISNSSKSFNWIQNTGSLRASFQSNYSNCTSGFNLGCIELQTDPSASTANTTYLKLDTSQGKGSTIFIPNTNSDFYLSIFDSAGQLMLNVPEYEVWLYFDTD
jgi:hypothetical protein